MQVSATKYKGQILWFVASKKITLVVTDANFRADLSAACYKCVQIEYLMT